MTDAGELVLGWDRSTPWRHEGAVDLDVDVGHPQGLARQDGDWWITTVDVDRVVGRLLRVAPTGEAVAAWELVDGERFHPGGCSFGDLGRGPELWIALAEYRPRSTTLVLVARPGEAPEPVFRVADHLGAVVAVDGDRLFAVTWGSREVVVLDLEGRELERRPNPSQHVDHQDLQHLGGDRVLCTGVADLPTPVGTVQAGGLAVWEATGPTLLHELPVPVHVPSGRSATYNPTHLEVAGGSAVLHAVPDDGRAALHRWRVG